MSSAEAQQVSGRAWSLLLPPGWMHLPTERAAGRRAVSALLDRQLKHLPRDTVATWRRSVERDLGLQLSDAASQGASDVYTLVESVAGLPVSASLTVARMPLGDVDLAAGVLSTFGAAGDVTESGFATLGGVSALRRVRRFARAVGPGKAPTQHLAVDWVVPLPDGDEALALSFTTSTAPLFEALTGLFDAMAASVEISLA
jgi:hypothetical protein